MPELTITYNGPIKPVQKILSNLKSGKDYFNKFIDLAITQDCFQYASFCGTIRIPQGIVNKDLSMNVWIPSKNDAVKVFVLFDKIKRKDKIIKSAVPALSNIIMRGGSEYQLQMEKKSILNYLTLKPGWGNLREKRQGEIIFSRLKYTKFKTLDEFILDSCSISKEAFINYSLEGNYFSEDEKYKITGLSDKPRINFSIDVNSIGGYPSRGISAPIIQITEKPNKYKKEIEPFINKLIKKIPQSNIYFCELEPEHHHLYGRSLYKKECMWEGHIKTIYRNIFFNDDNLLENILTNELGKEKCSEVLKEYYKKLNLKGD